jgi:hypothetical protein
MCGGPCPAGYYSAGTGCDFSCSNFCNNQTFCNKVEGDSFAMCGGPCPAGYHSVGTGCSFTCSNFCNNQTFCQKN